MSPRNDDPLHCERAVDLVAWLQGQLDPDASRLIKRHVADCFLCQQEERALEITLLHLSFCDSGTTAAPRLVGSVLKNIPSSAWSPSRWPTLLGVATAAAVLLCVAALPPSPTQDRVFASPAIPSSATLESNRQAAVQWIISQQDPEGFWVDDPAGSLPSVSATSRCLTALASSRFIDRPTQNAIDRGCAWLLRLQAPRGTIAAPPHDQNAHEWATLALVTIYVKTRWDGLKAPAHAAFAVAEISALPTPERQELESNAAILGWIDARPVPPASPRHWQHLWKAQRRDGRLDGSFAPENSDLSTSSRVIATARAVLLLSER